MVVRTRALKLLCDLPGPCQTFIQAAGWNAPSPFVDLKGILVPENFSLEFEKFTTSVILQFSNQFLPHTFLGPRIAGA